MATNMTDSQQRAVLSTGKNVLVSASAGSGKTYVMIERIIRLILEENVDVSNVLAVTFTKLAASEMKQKLVKAVIRRINDGKDVERMRKTLAEIPTADISTIHSFCLNLLKTYFYRANVDPDFKKNRFIGKKYRSDAYRFRMYRSGSYGKPNSSLGA